MEVPIAANIAIWKLPPGAGATLQPMVLDPPPASFNEVSHQLPQGAYTTFRTYDGGRAVLRLDEHLARLEESARLSGDEIFLDWSTIRAALRMALRSFAAGETRLRLTLDTQREPGTLYLVLEALGQPTPEAYARGVRAISYRMQRKNPKAKTTAFIVAAEKIRKRMTPDVAEAILVGADGQFLEGLSSNFFVVRDGELWTAEEGVLSGITRSLVLEEAAAEGVGIHLEGFARVEAATADEAFITSSGRGVLPVVEIDGQPVGNGVPGPITRRLLERYNERIAREVEPL